MKTIFAYDPWRLVENELHKDDMRLSESMTSIGNGHMGMLYDRLNLNRIVRISP